MDLAEIRAEAGLSRAALAEEMGVSWDTVRRAEGERDPRLSTLLRLLQALPHCSPARLLSGEPGAPPLASRSAWLFHRDAQGHVTRRLTHELRVHDASRRTAITTHEGVRGLSQDLRDDDGRTNLLRAIVSAPSATLRALRAEPGDLRGVARRFEADGAEHELRFPPPLAARGFTHAVTRGRERRPPDPALRGTPEALHPSLETLAADVDLAIERLVLRLVLPPGCAPPSVRAYAAPAGSLPPESPFRLVELLHPRGLPARWNASARVLELRVDEPQPHLRYGLALCTGEAPAGFVALQDARPRLVLGRLAEPSGAGATLRAHRVAARLSSREAARRASISVATLLAAESGADARASTLAACARAIDGLDASALLAGESASRPLSPAEAWHAQLAVAGVSADEAARRVVLDPRGGAREEIRWRGLRRLRGGDGEIVVRDAITATASGQVGPVFVEGQREAPLRIRWQRVAGEQPEYHLVVPAELARDGASFVRRERKVDAYKLRAAESGRSIGPAFECLVPAHRLLLSVRFPRGVRPAAVRASARAAAAVTNPRWPDLAATLHPSGFAFAWDEASGDAELRVERPLLGVRYSITWTPG